MTSGTDDAVTIKLLHDEWNGLVGEMQNAAMTLAEDGEDESEEFDNAIEISDAVYYAPMVTNESSASPEAERLATLTRTQWRLVLTCLNRSQPVYEQIGYGESHELGRRL